MTRLVECVPNVSEGRDRAVIDAVAAAFASVPGVRVLDVDAGADTNRTVYTFVGTPEAVSEAVEQGMRTIASLVDMRRHTGAHPRMGALDVCPIVPIAGITMEECVVVARELGRRLAEEFQLPVYFYEEAALQPGRRSLADVRAGEYEGLPAKLADPAWQPDCGPATFNARLGATVVGAREFLIAYNVNLNTRDQKLASDVALRIREAGRLKRDARNQVVLDEHGQQVRIPGRLKAVRAIGWYIEAYQQAQVSINLLSHKTTPLHVVYETVREEAAALGLVVTGSELVGMTPLEPLVEAGRYYLRRQGRSSGAPERELVDLAIRTLGLTQLSPFDPERRIIEYAVRPAAPLAAATIARFADEVSSASPAPGGGSVAALAGGLGAALAAMMGNLTVGKAGCEGAWEEAAALAERAQAVKAALLAAVDEDTAAFGAVLAAVRLPKATADQRQARDQALAAAYAEATRVPLGVARLSFEALTLAGRAAAIGNPNSFSDAAVGALLARAAVDGAALNVRTNLASVADRATADAWRAEAVQLQAAAASELDRIMRLVGERLP